MTQAPLITPEMLHLIAQLDEAKGQWQALRNLTPERLLACDTAPRLKASALRRALRG